MILLKNLTKNIKLKTKTQVKGGKITDFYDNHLVQENARKFGALPRTSSGEGGLFDFEKIKNIFLIASDVKKNTNLAVPNA